MDTRERKKEWGEVKPSPLAKQLVMKAIDSFTLKQLPMLSKEYTPLLNDLLFELEHLNLKLKYDKISIHEFYLALDFLAKEWNSEKLNEEIDKYNKNKSLDRVDSLRLKLVPAEVNSFFQLCFNVREMEVIKIKSLSENEKDQLIFRMIKKHIDLLRYLQEDPGVVQEIVEIFKDDTAMRDRYLLELLLQIILDDQSKQVKKTQIIKEIKSLASEVRETTSLLSFAGGSYLATPILSFMLYVVSPGFQWGSKKIGERFLSKELSDEFAAVQQQKPDFSSIKLDRKRFGLLKELAYRQSIYQMDLLNDAFHSHAGYATTLVLRLTALDYFSKKIQSGDSLNPEEIRKEMREVFGKLYDPMFETRGWGASYVTSFTKNLNLPALSKPYSSARPLSFFHRVIDEDSWVESKPQNTASIPQNFRSPGLGEQNDIASFCANFR